VAAVCGLAALHGLHRAVLAADPAPAGKLPKWSEIEPVVRKHFAEIRGFQKTDLISRSQAEPVFAKLAELGWAVADKAAILSSLPADSDFIVKELRTTQGRKFMRSIASYTDAYDRLDKLSQLPEGRSSIRTLIKGPGGKKLIDFLTSSTGRPQAGELLANSPHGHDFDGATGRIYTLDALVERLEQSYRAATEAAGKAEDRTKKAGKQK
jgi:hypothetical protein